MSSVSRLAEPSGPTPARAFLHTTAPPERAAGPACSGCHQHQGLQPCGLPGLGNGAGGRLAVTRRRVAIGQSLYRQGDEFRFVFAVRSGTFASTLALPDGGEKVCGFHMSGDMLALDGMASGRHASSATAIDGGEVCAMAWGTLLGRSVQDEPLRRHVGTLLARELVRTQRLMLMLSHMSAQERLAMFLLDLSRRFAALGQSRREFNLSMSRTQIGSYLGLTMETVSRTLTLFQQRGLLEVEMRRIRITDFEAFTEQFQPLAA